MEGGGRVLRIVRIPMNERVIKEKLWYEICVILSILNAVFSKHKYILIKQIFIYDASYTFFRTVFSYFFFAMLWATDKPEFPVGSTQREVK